MHRTISQDEGVAEPPLRHAPAWLPIVRLPRSVRSLRVRLALLVAGTMFPLVVVSALLVFENYHILRNATATRVMQATRGTTAAVDRELHNLIASLQVLALSPALHNRDLSSFRSEAQRFLNLFPPGHDITVSDASGQMVMNSGRPADAPLPMRNTQRTVHDIFDKAMPVVSTMFIGSLKKRPIFTIDVPVIEGGAVIYDLAFDPPMNIFANIIMQQQLPENWTISILDREGNQVARRPALGMERISKTSATLQAALSQRDDGIAETISLEGTPLITAFTRSPETGWVVAMGIPSETLIGPARYSLIVTIGAGILFVGFGLFFSGRMASKVARAEEHRDLMVNELDHRVRNTLSAVQSIVTRTLRGAATTSDAKTAIEGRLLALARAHSILGQTNWEPADLGDLTRAVLEPFSGGDTDRVRLQGPSLALKPQAAIAVTMVLNELATNAAKHGSLSVPSGRVALKWWCGEGEGDQSLHLRWREHGGPEVKRSDRRGFGSVLIERTITHELRGKIALELAPLGLVCEMEIPLQEATGHG